MDDVVIDRNTGTVKIISRGWEFGPHLSLEIFQGSASASSAQRISKTAPNYQIRTALADGWFWGMGLMFDQYMLRRIVLGFREKELTWADWSKEGEDAAKKHYDEFLLRQLGPPPYIFDWGQVLSVIDPHHHDAVMKIKYS